VAPLEAVQTADDGSLYVWVVDDTMTISKVPVSTGETANGFTVITDGLNLGEKVVTEFAGNLKDGQKVSLGGHKKSKAPNGGAAAAPDYGGPPAAPGTLGTPASTEPPASGASGGKHHHHHHSQNGAEPADGSSPA